MGFKKTKSIEKKRAKYGYIFLAPWVIGMLLFFIFPILQSVYFSFSDISISETGVKTDFIGMDNYKNILYVNPDYINNLISSIKDFLVSLPFILVISMILAILLNNNFRGRLFFRTLYFLPVIISSGIVLELFLTAAQGDATEVAISDSVSFGMINFADVLKGLNLPVTIEEYLSVALNNLFMMVWQSGIQILLFIAGLQSIPDLLYEVSKVEGATKWEEFWFITLPMLLRTILLVVVFTMVELITSKTNSVMTQSYVQFNNLEYGRGSAMLWLYFAVAGIFISVTLLIYKKVLFNKWG